jgi:hypothetical protein
MASSSCSFSCSTSTRPRLPSISLTDTALIRMWFNIAAFRSRFLPRDLCLAHTAIFELPLSTMLVAGCENCGDNREVMRKSRRRRFFFCMHECSPSISAAARFRFFGRGCGRGRNVRPMSGKGGVPKVKGVCCVVDAAKMNAKSPVKVASDDACSSALCIILLCPASCVVCKERWSGGDDSACSRDETSSDMVRSNFFRRRQSESLVASNSFKNCGSDAKLCEPSGSYVA